MSKSLPDWAIWLKLPTLAPKHAVALSFGLDPTQVSNPDFYGKKWLHGNQEIGGFSERLMLLKACHPSPISPTEFSSWAQSVEWNIPLKLSALSPVVLPAPEPAPREVVLDSLKTVVANGVPVETLLAELERLKVMFFTEDRSPFVQIPDGTVNGRRRPLTEIYAALSELFNTLPKTAVLGTLLRGSGASGGGATSSPHRPPTAPATADVLVIPLKSEVVNIAPKVDVPEADDVWWKIENDIFEMAQNIGASLKANRNSHSNGAIGEEIANRIKAMEFKKGKSRKTPSTGTVRKMLNGWRLKPS